MLLALERFILNVIWEVNCKKPVRASEQRFDEAHGVLTR